MQGPSKSSCLWEKHADKILHKIGLSPTVHKPCLYSGTINGNRILFMRQVDDFAIASPDERTSNILMDLIDDKLNFVRSVLWDLNIPQEAATMLYKD
jgi:hypothetical protein